MSHGISVVDVAAKTFDIVHKTELLDFIIFVVLRVDALEVAERDKIISYVQTDLRKLVLTLRYHWPDLE
jgi:hypothetical protein